MARKAPTGIHSEFRERIAFTVRAPESDSMRSMLMRRLVKEMTERHASGHLVEWMISALIDKMSDEIAIEQGVQHQASQWLGAAPQPGEGQGGKQGLVDPAAAVSLVQPLGSGSTGNGSKESAVDFKVAPRRLPRGLKAM